MRRALTALSDSIPQLTVVATQTGCEFASRGGVEDWQEGGSMFLQVNYGEAQVWVSTDPGERRLFVGCRPFADVEKLATDSGPWQRGGTSRLGRCGRRSA